MIKKCIKVPFVEEVTGKSGAQVVFVDTTTESLESTVQDAVDRLMVIGNAQLVKQNFVGLFRSMVAGVMRDGKPRKVEGFLRVYPVFYGAVDLDKGFDPNENGVYLAVELLNEMKLDISNWSFEDVTEGRQPIVIESVKGSDIGVVDLGKSAAINGRGLSGSHTVELQLEGGEVIKVDPAFVTGHISRMDIAAGAFEPFNDPANDGKEMTITVRGNFAKATRKVTIKIAPPSAPKILNVTSKLLGGEDKWKVFKDTLTVKLEEAIPKDADITLRLYDRATGEEVVRTVNEERNVVTRIDEHTFTYQVESNNGEPPHTDGDWADANEFIVKLVVESAAGSDSRELASVE